MKFLVGIVVLLLSIWAAWRLFVFVYKLMSPARAALRREDSVVGNAARHVETTMSESGMDSLVQMNRRLQSGIDRAVAETQSGIDERRK